MIYFLLLISSILFGAESDPKRAKLDLSEVVLAKKSPQSLQFLCLNRTADLLIDSVHDNETLALLETYPDNIQERLKGHLLYRHSELLNAAQKEEYKHRFDFTSASRPYFFATSDRNIAIFQQNQVNLVNIESGANTVFQLESVADLGKKVSVCKNGIYFTTYDNQIFCLDLQSQKTSLVYSSHQPTNVQCFSVLDDGKIAIESYDDNQINVMFIGENQVFTFPKHEIFTLLARKKYISIGEYTPGTTDYRKLYCVDGDTGQKHGPFLHVDDKRFGYDIPLVMCGGKIVSVIQNRCSVYDMTQKKTVRKIELEGVIFAIKPCKNEKKIIVGCVVPNGSKFVLLDINDATCIDLSEIKGTLTRPAEMIYAEKGIYCYHNTFLSSPSEYQWYDLIEDNHVFNKKNGNTESFYSYCSLLSLRKAPLTELLMLLRVFQQSQKSIVEQEVLSRLIESKTPRIREIALRYMPK